MSRAKITLKASFDNGEGSIGNLDKWRSENAPLLRADILSDWIYDLEKEYKVALSHMAKQAEEERLAGIKKRSE